MSETTRVVTGCVCSDPCHQMTFNLHAPQRFKSEKAGDFIEDAEMFVSVQLNPFFGFWGRCWLALRYVMGKRSKFGGGHWDEGSFSPDDARALRGLLERFVAMSENPEAYVEGDRTVASSMELIGAIVTGGTVISGGTMETPKWRRVQP